MLKTFDSINEQVSLNFDQTFTRFIFAKNIIVNSILYIYIYIYIYIYKIWKEECVCVRVKNISMQLTNALLNASDSILEKKESIHFDKRKIDIISRF